MAQPPQGTAAPVPAPYTTPRSISEVRFGYVFRPKARCLLGHYLVPRALDGRVPEKNIRDSVPEGVDVYAVRPWALPFPRCNRNRYGQVWGYFFTRRPAAATTAAGGPSAPGKDDVRNVAAGGCWRRYGGDGEVYAFRRRFAYHVGGRKTVWRMKELRLNEAVRAFRGAVFHSSAKVLVIWKVYNEVIPEEEPPVDYYNSDDEGGTTVMTVRGAVAAPACPAAS